MVEVFKIEEHVWAWGIGAFFAASAALCSFLHIRLHFMYSRNYTLLKYTVRILLMVPIYAFEAWLGLFLKQYALYWTVLRETYESLVVYSFYQFLVGYLGSRETLVEILDARHKEKQDQQKHLFPFNCLPPWQFGESFVHNTKLGILQYVPVKVITAIITFILEYKDKYGDGEFVADQGYPYIALIVNSSQIWALYCLVLFYMAMKEELKPIHPMPKFLCIKAVVFFTFWQSVVIAGFVHVGVITATNDYSEGDIAAGLQNFLVTIEMFFAALSHVYAFPAKEFSEVDNGVKVEMRGTLQKLGSIFHPKDLYHDVKDVMRKKKGGDEPNAVTILQPEDKLSEEEQQKREEATLSSIEEGPTKKKRTPNRTSYSSVHQSEGTK